MSTEKCHVYMRITDPRGGRMKKLDAYRCRLCGRLEYYESGAVLMPFMLNCPQCGQKNGLELDKNEKIKVYSL
jgi:uncharacterized OB-fold protein